MAYGTAAVAVGENESDDQLELHDTLAQAIDKACALVAEHETDPSTDLAGYIRATVNEDELAEWLRIGFHAGSHVVRIELV